MMRFRAALLPLLIALACPSLFGQKTKRLTRLKPIRAQVTVKAAPPTAQERRLEALRMAWYVINDRYFDKTFSGLNWDAIESEYEVKVRSATTDAQFHKLFTEMIKRLGKSHLAVITPDYFERIETAKKQAKAHEKLIAAAKATADKTAYGAGDEEGPVDLFESTSRYGVGVELRMIDGQAIVSRVDPLSGASLAGLKTGYAIQKISGVTVSGMIDNVLLAGTSLAEVKYMFPAQLIEFFLNGEPDTSVEMTVLDENDKPKELSVPRLRLAGQTVSINDNLPEQFLKYESKSLGPDVGYVKFNAFATPVIAKFCDSIGEFRSKKAIIVDLRGNFGGLLNSMIGLSGMMIDKPASLGNVVSRTGTSPFEVTPKAKQFKGRIVFLVDELSMSAAEIFTAGLQGNKRAIVVGSKTGGQSLPSIWEKLATGAILIYPIADFITPKGISLEGRGLEPDVNVALTRKSLLTGVDAQLAKAESVAVDDAFWVAAAATPSKENAKISTGDSGSPPLKALPTPAPKPRELELKLPDPPPPAAPQKVAGIGTTEDGKPVLLPSDVRSLRVVADFAAAVGGVEAFRAVTSYEAKGAMIIGTQVQASGTVYTARQFPDKYMMAFETPSLGEVREAYNGKISVLQTDAGIDRPLFPAGTDGGKAHLLGSVFNTIDPNYHQNLRYEGEFELEGRKMHVITGRDPQGIAIGMSFDSETKLLATYSMPGFLYKLSDYRKVGSVQLPFSVQLEGYSKANFDSVTLNTKLDPAIFERKEKCYDKAL